MKLYFVAYSDCDGNHDSLVEAEDMWQATSFWQQHYGFSERHRPDSVGEITITGKARFIPWEEINSD